MSHKNPPCPTDPVNSFSRLDEYGAAPRKPIFSVGIERHFSRHRNGDCRSQNCDVNIVMCLNLGQDEIVESGVECAHAVQLGRVEPWLVQFTKIENIEKFRDVYMLRREPTPAITSIPSPCR